jgi:gliding motility-associated-like protein
MRFFFRTKKVLLWFADSTNNLLKMKTNKLFFIAILTSMFFVFASQNANSQITNNSYGIPNAQWTVSVNKTNIILEKVDEMSFLNYVVVSSGGNLDEMSYFTGYVKGKLKKDKEELVYEIYKGAIAPNAPAVKTYLSSLQPKYSSYFADYKKRKSEIILSQSGSLRAPGTGGTPTPANCGSPCNNPGFETGTGFWDYSSGAACTSPDPCSLVTGFSSSAHVLEAVGGFDPIVGAALPLVAPGGGSASMMIGDGAVTGAHASRASISFTVDATSTNFTYRYAVVLQDPVTGHSDPERPYFKVKLRDALGNILPCGDYEVIAKPPIVGFTLASGTTDVYYRPWTNVFVPLGAYVGQCVTLEFTSSDCSQGGHFGYAYIDADCNPSSLISSSPAVCGGATVTLSAPVGAATYDWTNTSAGGTTGIVGSDSSQTVSINLGGTYQVVMTSVTGASCTSTLTITVPSNPSNPVSNYINTTVCAGVPTLFTDMSTPTDSATAWSWDFNNDGLTDSTSQNPSYIFAAGGTYPVTLTITWGPCNATFTQNVTVNPGGTPVITPVTTICSNAAPITLVETGTSGGSWSGTGITSATTGAFDPSTATTGTNIITYGTTGSCAASDTIHINVVASSSPAWTTTTLCASGAPVNLNTLITGTSGGTWSGTGVSGSTFTPTGLSGTIAVTYTVGTSPCVGVLTQNITVNSAASANIASGATLCTTDSPITLTAATAGGTWSGSTGINASTGVFTPGSVPPGSYTITYTISGTCGASDTAIVNVVQGGNPAWALPASICAGSPPINLSTLVTGTSGGTWSGPGVTGNMFDPSGLSGNQSITYSVGQTGCVSNLSLVIFVDGINAAFTATPNIGMAPLSVNFINGSSGAVSYAWSLGDGTNSTLTNPSDIYTNPGDYIVTLTSTNASGCSDVATLIIHVDVVSNLTIPNVFTPNGDGENDTFHPVLATWISSFDATVYDRWGLKMYEWNNQSAGWNGDAKNGKPAPDGTYYYIINAKGADNKDYLYTGFIQLLRVK